MIAYNTGTKAENETNGVPLNFKHALSQILVKAKCLNSNIKVEVLGVRIVNAHTMANFTFPETETKTSYNLQMSQWSDWSGGNTGNAYSIKGKSPVVLNTDPQSIMFDNTNFMLIPQQLTAWANNQETTGAYLSVLCRISNINGNDEVLLYPEPTITDAKVGKYAYSAVAIDTKWEPGKKYTYTLTFCDVNGGAGRIDPNPDSTDPNVDPNPIPEKEKGDLILGAPIKFTVSVQDWSEESVNITMN